MTMKDTAQRFFDACEGGKGWEGCRQYCHDGATFGAQAAALGDVGTLQAYTDWMKSLYTPMPDASHPTLTGSGRPGRGGGPRRRVRR